MSKCYFDDALNAHNHAKPRRQRAKEMMDFHPEQAFNVGIQKADPRAGVGISYLKKYDGKLTRDPVGAYVIKVTDPINPEVQKAQFISGDMDGNGIFKVVLSLANEIVAEQTVRLWREMGFVEAD